MPCHAKCRRSKSKLNTICRRIKWLLLLSVINFVSSLASIVKSFFLIHSVVVFVFKNGIGFCSSMLFWSFFSDDFFYCIETKEAFHRLWPNWKNKKKRLDLWKKNVSIVHFMALSMVAIPHGHICFSAAAAAVVAMAFVIKVKVLYGLCCTRDAANFIQTFLLVRINREWWSHFGDCTMATNMCRNDSSPKNHLFNCANWMIYDHLNCWNEMQCSGLLHCLVNSLCAIINGSTPFRMFTKHHR